MFKLLTNMVIIKVEFFKITLNSASILNKFYSVIPLIIHKNNSRKSVKFGLNFINFFTWENYGKSCISSYTRIVRTP